MKHYQPRLYEYPKFDATFRRLLSEAEAHSEAGRRPTLQQHQGIATTNGHSQQVRHFHACRYMAYHLCVGAWCTICSTVVEKLSDERPGRHT